MFVQSAYTIRCTVWKGRFWGDSLFCLWSFTIGKRQRILHFARIGSRSQVKAVYVRLQMGYKLPTIYRILRGEGLIANRMGIHKFLQKHRDTNKIQADQWRWWLLWKYSLSGRWGTKMKRPQFSCMLDFYPIVHDRLFTAESFWGCFIQWWIILETSIRFV